MGYWRMGKNSSAKKKAPKKATKKSVSDQISDAKHTYYKKKKEYHGHAVRAENEISKVGKEIYKILRSLGVKDADIPKVDITGRLSRLLK